MSVLRRLLHAPGARWRLTPALLVFAACQTTGPAPAESSAPGPGGPRKLQPPATLSLTARALLSRRMESHGFEMTNLMWATLMLDRAAAADISQSILSEPRLARPVARDGSELNNRLPPAFFDLQDQLVMAAKTLEAVASNEASTPDQLAGAFSKLTHTCVNCHAVYMYSE